MALNQAARQYYSKSQDITGLATTAIVRETFVKITGTRADGENIRVGTCGAGEKAFGVALFDIASGGLVTIRPLNSGSGMAVTAGAVITFGQEVQSDATGRAIPLAAGKSCGMALANAAATAAAQIALGN